MDNQTAFERLCGNCAGVDMASITDEDIRIQAQSFVESGELDEEDTDEIVEAAIRYLKRSRAVTEAAEEVDTWLKNQQ